MRPSKIKKLEPQELIAKNQTNQVARPLAALGDRRLPLAPDLGARSMPMTFWDYAVIIRRRLPYLIPVTLAVSLVGTGIAFYLPAVYRATGTIAVESQQISPDLVRSTVTGDADARIGFIKQLVMTDARLEGIIRQFDLYLNQRANQPMSKLVDRLRRDIVVASVLDPYSPGRATIAFTVSFEHRDPNIARDVAATLVDLFLAENTRRRSARATDTTEFLRREAERLSEQVRTLDSQVAAFKQEHSDALPEHLSLKVNMLETAEGDLRGVQRDLAASEQEKRFLETQRGTYGLLNPRTDQRAASAASPQERLKLLQASLRSYQEAYTDVHPDVIALKRRIAEVQAEIRSRSAQAALEEVAISDDPGFVEFQSRIAAADARLTSLRVQEKSLRERIAQLQGQILETPKVELGLRDLAVGYQSALKEYEDVRSKQQQAELAENLESQQMAERFLLLEAPTIPIVPIRPDRPKMLALTMVLALGCGVGAAVGAEVLDPRLRDPSMLEGRRGFGTLAVIPRIEQAAERRSRLLRRWLLRIALVAALPLSLVLLRYLEQPIREFLSHVNL
jgi:polysaccharide biosynthesis transport protein